MHGSMALVFAWLLVGGLGVPLPEDAALLAAGVLIERGATNAVFAGAVVLFGVLLGDSILFFAARRLGPAAYDRKLIRRVLPPERRAKIESAYQRYGGRLVFFARHVAGLRAAVFAMAGIHGMKPVIAQRPAMKTSWSRCWQRARTYGWRISRAVIRLFGIGYVERRLKTA